MLSAHHGGRIESAAGCCPVGSAVSGGVTKNNAIGAHPPSDGVTILAWVLKLPDTGSLRFNWSAGIRDGASSTDGIDFSVLVDGVSYWKLTKQNNSWVSGNIDLGLWRGKNILLELVTDSRAEFYFDWAAWADLTLTNSTVSCAYTLGPPVTIGAQGGPANLTVTTSSTCPWFVTSSAAWLTVTSGGSGVGTGNVSYAVAPNSGPPRLGISMVGGQVFIVTQADINGVLPKRVRSQLTSQ
jgi:hypothetical protein